MQAPLHLMDKTASTMRNVITRGSSGGVIETPNAHLSGLRCRVRTLSGREQADRAMMNISASHRIYVDGGTDVLERDQITIGSQVFIVEYVLNPDLQSWWLQLDCSEVR